MNQCLSTRKALGPVDQNNLDLARKCLRLVRDIAERGAESWDPADVGYAIQELTQVLHERTGDEDRVFEPIPANEIEGLEALHEELQWVDGFSRDMCCQKRCN
jgi:hypothetical protein